MHHVVQHWWGKERQLESIHRYTGQIEIEIWLPATTCHNVAQRGRDELNPASKAWPFSSSHSLDQFEVSKKKKKAGAFLIDAYPPSRLSTVPPVEDLFMYRGISPLRKFRKKILHESSRDCRAGFEITIHPSWQCLMDFSFVSNWMKHGSEFCQKKKKKKPAPRGSFPPSRALSRRMKHHAFFACMPSLHTR